MRAAGLTRVCLAAGLACTAGAFSAAPGVAQPELNFGKPPNPDCTAILDDDISGMVQSSAAYHFQKESQGTVETFEKNLKGEPQLVQKSFHWWCKPKVNIPPLIPRRTETIPGGVPGVTQHVSAKLPYSSDPPRPECQAVLEMPLSMGMVPAAQSGWEVVAEAPFSYSRENRMLWICPPKGGIRIPPFLPTTAAAFPFGNPSPPGSIQTPIGLDVGINVETSRFQSTFIEFFAPTGEETSRNSFGSTGINVGGHVGFVFPVFIPRVPSIPGAVDITAAVGPTLLETFFEIEVPNNTSKFPFANGSFISVQHNFEATFGINAGPGFIIDPATGRTVWLYSTVGVSVENQTSTINFIPTSSSQSNTVFGFTAGFGGAVTVPGWPAVLTGEYRHTFWQPVNFNMPGASPTSNFQFKGEEDKFSVGIRFFPDILLHSRAR